MNFYKAKKQFDIFLKELRRSEGTRREYNKDLIQLQKYLENVYNKRLEVSDVTEADLENYLTFLMTEKGYKPSSRNRQMNTIRSFFKFCLRMNIIENNPAEVLVRLEEAPRNPVFLKPTEVNELVNAIKHPLIKLVIFTLFHTGLRINECLELKLSDVNFAENKITVRNGKGNKKRVIPLHKDLKIQLEHYIEKWRVKSKSEKLFITERTGSLSDVYVNKILKETVRNLGWNKNVTCHVLRHSFASALLKNNVSIVAVKELLGHENIKTTSSYAHIHQEDIEEGIQTLSIK